MKKTVCFTLLLFLVAALFGQSLKVGVLDSTRIEDPISLELSRYIYPVKVHYEYRVASIEVGDTIIDVMHRVPDIYDGDTPTLEVYLGLATISVQDFRMSGIQAPEIRFLKSREEAIKSRLRLIQLTEYYDYLFIQTFPERSRSYTDDQGKYGRFINVLYGVKDGLIISINDQLVREGFAVYRTY